MQFPSVTTALTVLALGMLSGCGYLPSEMSTPGSDAIGVAREAEATRVAGLDAFALATLTVSTVFWALATEARGTGLLDRLAKAAKMPVRLGVADAAAAVAGAANCAGQGKTVAARTEYGHRIHVR